MRALIWTVLMVGAGGFMLYAGTMNFSRHGDPWWPFIVDVFALGVGGIVMIARHAALRATDDSH